MSRPAPDLTGHRFGLLLVTGRAPSPGGPAVWRCECRCGRAVERTGGSLRDAAKRGGVPSCGCLTAARQRLGAAKAARFYPTARST